MTLPVYEETKQALGFDPDAEHEFDTELPPDLYPSTLRQWLQFLHEETADAIIVALSTDDDPDGGGETVRGAHDDSAQVGETGTVGSDSDPGASPAVQQQ